MTELRYDVVRSRRRTVSVIVSEGRVTVRAPLLMPADKIEKFIAAHEDWIAKKLAAQSAASSKFAAVTEGRALLLDGTEMPLVCGAAKNTESCGAFYMKNIKAVHPYFIKTRAFLLVESVGALSRRFGLYPEDVAVRDFKARWGSCDAQRNIKLNWRLLMLPPALREYVIVHELCHLKHLDHSAAFWAEVERCIPGYKARRKALKEYSFLTLLYR